MNKNKINSYERNYYDPVLYRRISELLSVNVYKGLKELKRYINDYPNDISALSYYASNLITIGEYDEAEKILEKSWKAFGKRKYEDVKMENKFIASYLFSKIRILCHKEKYNEVLKLADKYKELLIDNDIDIGIVIYYCRIKLNMDNMTDRNSYSLSQMRNYDENLFKERLKKHLMKYKMDEDIGTNSVFNEDFPVDIVIEEVKKNLIEKNKITPGFYENEYYFKYDNNGSCLNNKERKRVKYSCEDESPQFERFNSDYFKVVTLKDTNNIVAMYPYENKRKYPYVDLNYLNEKENNKIKRKSQIDKFNERYKKY